MTRPQKPHLQPPDQWLFNQLHTPQTPKGALAQQVQRSAKGSVAILQLSWLTNPAQVTYDHHQRGHSSCHPSAQGHAYFSQLHVQRTFFLHSPPPLPPTKPWPCLPCRDQQCHAAQHPQGTAGLDHEGYSILSPSHLLPVGR